MKVLPDKSITDVPGILACGISCGIKKDGKKDLCIIYSSHKSAAAAVFTSNKIKGAPVIVSMEHIKNLTTQAIVANSGNANVCTGKSGIEDSYTIAETAAKFLKLSPSEVLVASTGALGNPLPMEAVLPGIEKACLSLSTGNGFDAANAILTTDTIIKSIVVEFELEGKPVRMGGIAKGTTMIHPDMGTLLSFIVTNANISKPMLDKALKASVDKSYNMISIDGDTSTNDMAVIIANALSGNSLIDCENQNFCVFRDALDFVTVELAKMIARDGEGASKLMEVEILRAKTPEDAKKCAKAVISSTLVKCAFFGKAADWTKILCSIGYSGADLNPNDIDIFIDNGSSRFQAAKNSLETGLNKDTVRDLLSGDYIKISIDLKNGECNTTAWGCDLGPEYVKANAYLK